MHPPAPSASAKNDLDNDGCKKKTPKDPDDDGDGRADGSDGCPQGETGWTSARRRITSQTAAATQRRTPTTTTTASPTALTPRAPPARVGLGNDLDGDGCKNPEDTDDDADTVADGSETDARTGRDGLELEGPGGRSRARDGCRDSSEDSDDDNEWALPTPQTPVPQEPPAPATTPTPTAASQPRTADDDGDARDDGADNCPSSSNPGQDDLDADGAGDACDSQDNRPPPPPPASCVVPKVKKGSKLGAAKKQLVAANCTAGKVSRVRSVKVPKGKVVKLKTKAGTSLPAGTAVAIVVSAGV